MSDTPYYRDCVWEQFSEAEYKRRYAALRDKMKEHKLDAVVVPGGPSHWSFGAGMTWLTGHWEWHALCCYVLVPRDGEPTMIYSMGGTHAEAVRRHVAVGDQGRAPLPQRPVRAGDGGAAARAEAREGPDRPDGDRPAPRRLPAGQPVQHAAQGVAGRRARVHQELPARPRGDPLQGRARLRAQGRHALRERHGGDGGARQARREGIRAEGRGGRRHHGRRRRHRLPHHRLDADGQSGADLRQPAPVRRAC